MSRSTSVPVGEARLHLAITRRSQACGGSHLDTVPGCGAAPGIVSRASSWLMSRRPVIATPTGTRRGNCDRNIASKSVATTTFTSCPPGVRRSPTEHAAVARWLTLHRADPFDRIASARAQVGELMPGTADQAFAADDTAVLPALD